MHMKVDHSVINRINKRNVLELVRKNGPISKTELAQLTNLSLPTVMKITNELIEKGSILDLGKGSSTGGKPPTMLEFNFNLKYIIGVSINNYRIDMVLMDMAKNIIAQQIMDISETDKPDRILKNLVRMIQTMMATVDIPMDSLLGIGIGFYGMVDVHTGNILESKPFGWYDIDFAAPIKKAFNLPVIVDSVTRAITIGESLLGHGIDAQNFVCINLGEAINAAIVINGKMHYGSHYFSGNIGDMFVDIHRAKLPGAIDGSLNAVASDKAIVKNAQLAVSQLKRGETSQILDLVYGHVDRINIYTVIEAVENGDVLAKNLLLDAVQYLTIALAGIISNIDPEMIIIEGRIVRNSKFFTQELRKNLSAANHAQAKQAIRIEFSTLGKHMEAIGAAAFILDRYIDNCGELTLKD